MNEDENGITPANVTAMTMDLHNGNWWIIIEQGNGDVIKEIELTPMERINLAALLSVGNAFGNSPAKHLDFVDESR